MPRRARGPRWCLDVAGARLSLRLLAVALTFVGVALGTPARADPPAKALPVAATPTHRPEPTHTDELADLPLSVTPDLVTWPNPSSPPAWIQWLGWSDDGHRLAWRQGPEWAQMLPGTPIEIVRLDDHGNVVTRLHQRQNPGVALKAKHIRTTEPLFVERKSDRDVLLRTSNGRMLAIVVRPGLTSVAAVLEKNRRSYEPIARWLIRGPANRVDVMAFEDLRHRLLALVVHADSGPLRQAHVAVLSLSRKAPTEFYALTLPEAATATSPRQK